MLPNRVIVLCPQDEIARFQEVVMGLILGTTAVFVDPRWGLEQIISRLARFALRDTDIL